MSEKFIQSATKGRHRDLAGLSGSWMGNCKTWFEPDELADTSPWSATVRPILEGRFMLLEYEGSLQGKAFSGLAILGYSLAAGKNQMAWVDSFHNGTNIMFCQGEGERFSATGSYGAGEGPDWGWRTEIEMRGEDELVLTMFNITPDGNEAKAVETVFNRIQPK